MWCLVKTKMIKRSVVELMFWAALLCLFTYEFNYIHTHSFFLWMTNEFTNWPDCSMSLNLLSWMGKSRAKMSSKLQQIHGSWNADREKVRSHRLRFAHCYLNIYSACLPMINVWFSIDITTRTAATEQEQRTHIRWWPSRQWLVAVCMQTQSATQTHTLSSHFPMISNECVQHVVHCVHRITHRTVICDCLFSKHTRSLIHLLICCSHHTISKKVDVCDSCLLRK